MMKPGMLFGAVLLSLGFGSLHAFSVLALPLQSALAATRAEVSYIYGLAIVALTAGVYCSRFFMRLMSPAAMAGLCAAMAGAGLLLAGSAWGIAALLVGYGLMFGFANGLAYSLFLACAGVALPKRKGFAIGLVTATYGGGAAIFAPILNIVTQSSSVFSALVMLALSVFIGGLIVASLFAGSRFDMIEKGESDSGPLSWMWIMWSIYFCGAIGGLMIIGNAAPLIEWRLSGTALSSLAVMFVALGNVAGSIAGGIWAQHASSRWALTMPIMLGAMATASLLLADDRHVALAALFTAGLAYGGLIAAVPVVVVMRTGAGRFSHNFGRIFSAWGVAGLTGPTIAGTLFDIAGTYSGALVVALSTAITALILATFFLDSKNKKILV